MNWVDFLILFVWAVSAFLGWQLGVFGVVCSVAALFVASILAAPVGELFSFLPGDKPVQAMVGFVVVFALEIGVVRFVTAVWSPVTSWVPLVGFANKLAGGIVGFVFGFLLLLLVAAAVDRLPASGLRATVDTAVARSALSPLVVNDYNLFDQLVDLI